MKKFFKIIFIALAIFIVAGCGETQSAENDSAAQNPPVAENKSAEDNKTVAQVSTTAENKPVESKPVEKVPPVEKNQPVVISFAGDCTLGGFKGSGYPFEDYWANGADYYFSNVKNIFAADDITFVNLEGPLTLNPQVAEKQFPMRGEPKYVEILKAGSVEICNLSNNHIYDCGEVGFNDTVKLLQDNNIKYCGEGYSAVIEVRGLKVGFLGFLGWYDGEDVRNEISTAINKMRPNVDVIITEFHWGAEKEYFADSTQESLAHFTIDSGADIVVGAHSHVVQGIELYKGKIIAYSLANFCFGANMNPVDKDTFILQTSIVKQGNNLVIMPQIIPCKISSVDYTNDFCPTPASGNEAARILNKIADSSKNYPQTINF